MLTRFAILSLLLAANFPGCKKNPAPAGGSQMLNPSPAPSASLAPTVAPPPKETKPAIDQTAQVVIFGYHRFVNKVRRPDTEILPANFEAQMKELKDKGVAVIGMQDFLAWKRGEKSIPPKCAIITIDDGYKSGYEVAWPILKKYEYPVTMFIYTEGIKPGGRYAGGESMTWDQLAEMRDAGVDIQAHSATHQDLRKHYDKVTKKKLSPEEYEAWLTNEVAGSKQVLEQKLGIKVNCFAVPFGYHDPHVQEVVMKAGYEGMFTVYGQRLTFNAPNNLLGRYLIEGNKPKVFSDAANFSGSTSGGAVPVSEVSKTSLAAQPADGETIRTASPLIKANLSSFGTIDPGSVQMRVSGLGLVPATFDDKAQTVTYQVTQKLRDTTCTVIVAAKSSGKKVEASWTFAIDEAAAGVPVAPTPAAPPSASPAKK